MNLNDWTFIHITFRKKNKQKKPHTIHIRWESASLHFDNGIELPHIRISFTTHILQN